ncbi:MAG TPA: DUF1553 domain-containing protein, partial [Armatimonadota bacterium]|nr:DUF1553 domain-containing protein [Armatimonadota bacterium]
DAEKLATQYPDFRTRRAALAAEQAAEAQKRITLTTLRALYDQDAAPAPTRLLVRGDWSRLGDPVDPGVPAILDNPARPFRVAPPAPGSATTGRRRAFAEWLTRPEHPLTARVVVNRLWAHHFGVGLVPSVENFGRSGMAPTHQPLLDWLSVGLTRGISGSRPWTLKALHRLMVTSSAYRQGSASRAAAAKLDPENRLLWRQRPRRLEAEAIRDGMLAVSGTLDARMFGDPVPTEERPTGEIIPAGEDAGGRRSLYLLVRRSLPVTLLNTFDAPVMETNCTRRTTSTTATQALALMNSSFISSQAAHFARRVLRERPVPADGALPAYGAACDHAIALAFSRPATAAERAAAVAFLAEQSGRYGTEGGKSLQAAREQAFTDLCQALLSANEFVYID